MISVANQEWQAALPPLRDVIAAHDLRAKKSLGQNFLMDSGITDRIAASAGTVTDATLIEIGPGPGGLTRSLLGTDAKRVIAIEFDPRACGAMADLSQLVGDRLHVIQDDALKLDWAALLAKQERNILVANLPYNISTVLLVSWLRILRDHPGLIDRMVLMFQKEVAERLMARPGTKDYGRLSVLTQWITRTSSVMTLPPGAFVPPPKIYSSVVRFDPQHLETTAPRWETMDVLLRDAFGQRRKMLRSNLKHHLHFLDQIGVAPTLRAEDVTVEQYLQLARLIDGGAV